MKLIFNYLQEVERTIGYEFNNKELLVQAFTRSTFSNECGGANNEILEFGGDKVLDFIVTKVLLNKYGFINNEGQFSTQTLETEGQFTEVRKSLVNKEMLASRIEDLGLDKYLLLGKTEMLNVDQDYISIKEDLFESILGAVAIDCNWNFITLEKVVKDMLDIDEYLSLDVLNIKNYTNLFQEWYQKKYKESPIYQIKENKEGGYTVYFSLKTSKGETKYQESAQSKSKARALLAETMYKDLITLNEIPSIKSEFASKITYELSINTLQELYQKKIISEPIYQTPDKQVYDNNGNPVWTCACYVESHKVKYEIAASSKSDAKKKAAYACLSEIYNSL